MLLSQLLRCCIGLQWMCCHLVSTVYCCHLPLGTNLKGPVVETHPVLYVNARWLAHTGPVQIGSDSQVV